MDGRTHRNVADRQRIASADRCLGTGHQRAADFQTTRGDDIAALTVGVAHQRDVRCAVRVVLNALDLGSNAVLVALEIDHAVVVLVTTALVAGGDTAIVVAASLLELRLQQRRIAFTLVQVVTRDLHHGALAG